jgi:Cdc6-like AAA superfamily ATPase
MKIRTNYNDIRKNTKKADTSKMKKPENPFNPNSAVVPALFAGRTDTAISMLRKFRQVKSGQSSSFIFTGERGIGKTALAKFVKYMVTINEEDFENLNFITSYYAVEKDQDFGYVLQTSLNQLTDQLPDKTLDRLQKRVGDFFKNGKFAIGAFGAKVEMDKKEREVQKQHLKDVAVSIFTNILKGIEEAEDPHNGILIIIDEAHNISDMSGIAMLLRNIATTLDINGLGRVSFLIIGYPHAIDLFFDGDPSAKRHFDNVFLDRMPLNEAKEILIKGFNEVNLKYDEKDLDNFIAYTGGYPHAVQVLGHNVVEKVYGDEILNAHWIEGVHLTAKELASKDFSNLYKFNKKTTSKEVLMDILAVVGKPVTRQELSSLTSDKNLSRTINELRKIGAIKIDKNTSKISLSSMLFNMAILFHISDKFTKENYLYDLRVEHNPALIQSNSSEQLLLNED